MSFQKGIVPNAYVVDVSIGNEMNGNVVIGGTISTTTRESILEEESLIHHQECMNKHMIRTFAMVAMVAMTAAMKTMNTEYIGFINTL